MRATHVDDAMTAAREFLAKRVPHFFHGAAE
jgi:hypothetical protein